MCMYICMHGQIQSAGADMRAGATVHVPARNGSECAGGAADRGAAAGAGSRARARACVGLLAFSLPASSGVLD